MTAEEYRALLRYWILDDVKINRRSARYWHHYHADLNDTIE